EQRVARYAVSLELRGHRPTQQTGPLGIAPLRCEHGEQVDRLHDPAVILDLERESQRLLCERFGLFRRAALTHAPAAAKQHSRLPPRIARARRHVGGLLEQLESSSRVTTLELEVAEQPEHLRLLPPQPAPAADLERLPGRLPRRLGIALIPVAVAEVHQHEGQPILVVELPVDGEALQAATMREL